MAKSTLIQFHSDQDISATVEQWAKTNGFSLKHVDQSKRTYQKGTGFLVAPMMFSFDQQGGNVAIEAWIRVNLFMRVMALFILPSQMSVESGGFRAALPRSIARKAVNKLLAQLQQPLIQ